MCDYSLLGVPNRLAVEGEELVVHRFDTGSMGLTEPLGRGTEDLNRPFWAIIKEWFIPAESRGAVAVCISPGAALLVHWKILAISFL